MTHEMPTVSDWLLARRPQSRSVGALLCVPPAGGQAQQFTPWTRMLPSITVFAVRMPGRGWRRNEPRVTDIKEAAEAVALAIRDASHQPLVIFGHSFGAILGFEIATALTTIGVGGPRMLCVSASPAPSRSPGFRTDLIGATRNRLAAVLKELGPVPSAQLTSPQMLDGAVEAFRSDLRLLADYRPDPSTRKLPIPIHAFRGGDDPTVTRADALVWKRHGSSLAYTEHQGGHSAILANPAPVTRVVTRVLANR